MWTRIGAVVFGSIAHPVTWISPLVPVRVLMAPNGVPARQGRWWLRVALSTRTAVPHVESVCHGGTQVTTRHTIGPRQATFWWHWP